MKHVLFYVDLTKIKDETSGLPENISVEFKKSKQEVSEQDIKRLIENMGKGIVFHLLDNRFKQGAILWLIKVSGELVGFVWSIKERPVKSYFFPLTKHDVHLFDNEIFHNYRGQGINTILIKYTLLELKNMGIVRAFIETRIWNSREIASLSKTYFEKYAMAMKLHIFRSNITIWVSK